MRYTSLILVVFLISSTACTQSGTSGHATVQQGEKILLNPAEFQAAIQSGDAILVDVRTPQEYASGHIPGSINLDWTANDYEQQFDSLDPDRPVLLYCAIGGRSDQARAYLQAKGYEVRELEDGISSWKDAGLPLER